MLFQSPEEIAKQATAAKLLPVSVVLLHLFTYAPDDMVPPHNARGWTLVEFSVRAPRPWPTGTPRVLRPMMPSARLGACPKMSVLI